MNEINQLYDDLNRQGRRIRELERQLADSVNNKLPVAEHLDPDLIWVESMVSAQTGEPRIILRWFTHYTQLDVEQAREIAFNIFEAIEAAKSDSFISAYGKRIGLEPQQVAGLIYEFRQFRTAKEKNNGNG